MPSESIRPEDLGERVSRLETMVAKQQQFVRGLLELIVWLAIAAPVAVLLLKFPRPNSLIYRELFNLSHVVLSGGVALIVLRLSRRLLADIVRAPLGHFIIAAVVTAGVGGGLELVQLVGPGDASLSDLVRDGCGLLAALALARSVDPQWSRATPGTRWLMRGAAGLALLASFALSVRAALPLLHRRASFPVLASFDSPWDARLVAAEDGARLAFSPPPPEFSLARGPKVAAVQFHSGRFPKLEIAGYGGDWSQYHSLVFEVYSPRPEPVLMELRVHDRQHRNAYRDRFNRRMQIVPGETTVRIPVTEIRDAPAGRRLDLARVEALILFMNSPSEPVTLYFDSFRLEK